MTPEQLRSLPPNAVGIVASSDDNYAPHLTVLFYSLLANCSAPERVSLFCLDGGISDENKARMNQEVKTLGGSGVDFVSFNSDRYDNLPTIKHITSSAYYRISIPEIFDDSVHKLIYLDCDMIVKGDIIELWDTDIADFHIGAVENLSGHTYKKLGIPQNQYFNSGMLLINLDLWRRDGIPEKVFRFKKENPDKISTNDQCALNGVLHDKWKHLHLKWNQQTGLYRPSEQTAAFSPSEIEEATLSPGIIHYIGWDKPWRKVRFHPLANEYDRFADRLETSPRIKPGFGDYLQAYASVSRLKKLRRQLKWQAWYKEKGYDLYR
ncbi:glycosyltransferase family 8 protein [Marinobacter antarcticus]|uniref:Glycosyltransferase family 8 protein n=2 Tax=root TaxID=1 RepID=A0A831VWG3_9GAMM|nr:glycosyltransferase family 8 protein [Marinobacter antarcticus]HEA54103.1 glycosyltransferase family 8 protein [Marinobacter antarcticus]